MTEREDDDEEESQVVRKGDDAKAHKELNKLGGDMDGEKEVDTGKAQDALTKLAASGSACKSCRFFAMQAARIVRFEMPPCFP